MSGLSKLLGARLGSPLYHFLRNATLAYERKNRQRFDPASLKARPRLELKHTEVAQLLPDRETMLARLPKGGIAVELGVDQGDFSAQMLRSIQPQTLHLVDIWASERYNEDKAAAVMARFASLGEQIVIHRKDSLSGAADFADDSLNLVYIDTTHSYELTIAELEAYRPKMAPGGILAGHDYVVGNWQSRLRYGVIEAVHEFCVRHHWRILYISAEHPGHPSFALEAIASPAPR